MAGELEVTFRGMFVLAMPPVGSRNHARILMPRNEVPRVARGNERYTIPPYESYVAIPMSANPSPEPNLVADLPVDHAETFDARATASVSPQFEAVSRTLRRKRVLMEPPKERYAIYFTNGCEIVADPLRAADKNLQYDSSPVADNQRPVPGERSVNWLAPMRSGTDNTTVAAALLADLPQATSSYIDLSKGTMRPLGLLPIHRWRYLHASNDTFNRPIAQELLVTSQADGETVTITLQPIGDGAAKVITFRPGAGDRIIIGCEPLDDILGNSSVPSCVEPAYDFELQYDLIGGPRSTSPVPLCAQNSDHRSPPSAACGPPVTPGP